MGNGMDVRTEGKERRGGRGGSLRDECEGSLYYGARTHAREGKVTVYGCSIWLMLTH